jgi:MFS family permease
MDYFKLDDPHFCLAIAALSLPIGRISDVMGIRKVFLYGIILHAEFFRWGVLKFAIDDYHLPGSSGY